MRTPHLEPRSTVVPESSLQSPSPAPVHNLRGLGNTANQRGMGRNDYNAVMSAESSPIAPEPLKTPAGSPTATWQELEEVVDELTTAARQCRSAEQFYGQVIDHCVKTLAAVGGAVWLRTANQTMQPLATGGWHAVDFGTNEAGQAEHEAILAQVAASGRVLSVNTTANGQSVVLIVGAVNTIRTDDQGYDNTESGQHAEEPSATPGIIEIIAPSGQSPRAYKGQERFLQAVCEIASEFHAFRELAGLRTTRHYHRQLFAFSQRVHQAVGRRHTAYEVANEGCQLLGCDRLSVVIPGRGKCRLIATSGIHRVERRSQTVYQIEQLAAVVRGFKEPIYYTEGTTENLPQVAEQFEEYVDQSHAREVALVPITLPSEEDNLRHANSGDSSQHCSEVLAVLIAEQFDTNSSPLVHDRIVDVGEVCATAFAQAARWDRLPLRWLSESFEQIGNLLLPNHFFKTIAAAVALVVVILALCFIPTGFYVETGGTLQPQLRRNVFAARSGLIEEVLVQPDQRVQAEEELLRLHDPVLELELKRVTGQISTTIEQLEAVRATKTGRAAGKVTRLESYRLSAEQRQLEQQLTNLRQELELLDQQRNSLIVRSPIAGEIITWDIEGLLTARPVERGQALLTIADLESSWQLELNVADDRIGYVVAARQRDVPELPVEFRLTADERHQYQGHVTKIAQIAEPTANEPGHSPTVRVTASWDKAAPEGEPVLELRPGMTVRARIACGRRSLGYVWLHDLWDAVRRLATF